jgi:hypothetical protein
MVDSLPGMDTFALNFILLGKLESTTILSEDKEVNTMREFPVVLLTLENTRSLVGLIGSVKNRITLSTNPLIAFNASDWQEMQ